MTTKKIKQQESHKINTLIKLRDGLLPLMEKAETTEEYEKHRRKYDSYQLQIEAEQRIKAKDWRSNPKTYSANLTESRKPTMRK